MSIASLHQFSESLHPIMQFVGTLIDLAGVVAVLVGASVATYRYLVHGMHVEDGHSAYRHDLARAILLGLEFLVAGDIVRTVVVDPTLHNVLVLAFIVLIRTFLSVALQFELAGRWPWGAPVGTGRT